MKLKEFLRFVYSLMMGVSTPRLKRSKRYLFPIHREEIDPEFGLFLGGSCVCGFLQGGDDLLVINTNQAEPAKQFMSWLDERTVRGAAIVVLTSMGKDFSGGVPLYSEAKRIITGIRNKDAVPENWPKEITTRLQFIETETVIDIGDERVRLIPIEEEANGTDLAVYLEKRSTLFTGPLFFNRIHPVLASEIDVDVWIKQLEKLLSKFEPKTIVPAEGDLASVDDVREFVSYLKALSDPAVEFSECRQKYDWPEIPATTSLEENFDTIRALSGKRN